MMVPPTIPPAGGWRAPGREQPLLCWRESELAALRDVLDAALAAWSVDWGVVGVAGVACSVATESSTLDAVACEWLQWQAGSGGWLHGAEDVQRRLEVALFAMEAARGTAAAQLALACEQDARARVLGLFALSVTAKNAGAPGTDARGPWSGAVQIFLPPPLGWRLLLQAQVVQAWCRAQGLAIAPAACRPRNPLTSASDALAESLITLAVRLEGCQLELGALQRLQPGDVVRLQHPVAAPASVVDATGAALFQAYLGRSGSLKAVELARSAPAEISHQEVIA